MKKLFLYSAFISILFCTNRVSGQNAADADFVILQVVLPLRASGETELIFYYGNGKSEVFKKVEYSLKYEPALPNEIANALNYMSTKGYTLKTTVGSTGPLAPAQYIFEKRALLK